MLKQIANLLQNLKLRENGSEQKNSSSIDAVVGSDDLITKILLRVPAKSVLKFKLVSKKWLFIISQKSFAIHHTHLHPPTISSLLFRDQSSKYNHFSLDGKSFVRLSSRFLNFDPNNPGSTHVSQSCNGLLLCSRSRSRSDSAVSSTVYYIFNPSTGQFAMLPPPPVRGRFFNRMQLVFDPLKSSDYQVVCTLFFNKMLDIHVYSSETKTWKLCVDQQSYGSLSVNFNSGVFSNGAIHWISSMGNGFSFLLDEKRFQTIPKPPLLEYRHKQKFRYFGGSGGQLHLIGLLAGSQNPEELNIGIISPDISNDQTIVVYAIGRDCTKWFVKYCLLIKAIIMAYPEIIKDRPVLPPFLAFVERMNNETWPFSIEILSFIERNNETGPLMVMSIPGRIISYNFKDKTFSKIFSFSPSNQDRWDAFRLIETLSWV